MKRRDDFLFASSLDFVKEMVYVSSLLDDAEIRAVPHMESMISIFRSLDATCNAKVFQFQSPGKPILNPTSDLLSILLLLVKV